jgi:2-haloacid dehalogenase
MQMGFSRNGKKTIVSDFGNVLVAWDPRFLYSKMVQDSRAVEDYLAEVGFAEWNHRQDLGRPFSEGVRELCERFPQYSELIRAYDERWIESVGGPMTKTVELLGLLKRAGHELYGLSNWSAEEFKIIRAKYEFFSWFDGIFVSGEVGKAKPDPAFYQTVLDAAGKPAAECVFIDDSRHNIAAAADMGFETIHFRSGEQLEEELRARGIL